MARRTAGRYQCAQQLVVGNWLAPQSQPACLFDYPLTMAAIAFFKLFQPTMRAPP